MSSKHILENARIFLLTDLFANTEAANKEMLISISTLNAAVNMTRMIKSHIEENLEDVPDWTIECTQTTIAVTRPSGEQRRVIVQSIAR